MIWLQASVLWASALLSEVGRSLRYEEAEHMLLKALEPGCDFWDTAVCHIRSTNIFPLR